MTNEQIRLIGAQYAEPPVIYQRTPTAAESVAVAATDAPNGKAREMPVTVEMGRMRDALQKAFKSR
jgi:hypothetical protein